jgi:tripartite-type tricarboxylate transporter receptor subunit TctC
MVTLKNHVLVLVAGGLVLAGVAAAQSGGRAYPYKPIRWVTGGGPDAMARILGQKMTEVWGQQVVVDERAGGGGMMSAETVARANPDGYTLLLATGTHAISPNYFKVGYDMRQDFTAVSLLGTICFVLTVHPSLPVHNVQELIALARAKPGAINYTSGGTGSPAHIIMEYLRLKAPMDIVHVPYKSVGQAVAGLIGNQAQVMFAVSPSAVPQVAAGRLRALAVSTRKRSPALPDLPTMVEAGIADFDAAAWNGLLVPAHTPREVVIKLHERVAADLKLPDVIERTACWVSTISAARRPCSRNFCARNWSNGHRWRRQPVQSPNNGEQTHAQIQDAGAGR